MSYLPYYIVVIITSSIIASLPFTRLNQSNYLYLVGLVLALISNATWLSLTRVADKIELARLGLVWDGLLTLCYVLIPVLLGARFSLQMGLGVVLIVVGLTIVKGG